MRMLVPYTPKCGNHLGVYHDLAILGFPIFPDISRYCSTFHNNAFRSFESCHRVMANWRISVLSKIDFVLVFSIISYTLGASFGYWSIRWFRQLCNRILVQRLIIALYTLHKNDHKISETLQFPMKVFPAYHFLEFLTIPMTLLY